MGSAKACTWRFWLNFDFFFQVPVSTLTVLTRSLLDRTGASSWRPPIRFCEARLVKVSFFQKHLFLHQLTLNMTKDCPLNCKVQCMKIPCSEHVVYKDCFFSFCFDIENNLWTQLVLSLEFSCIELVIQWTICRHIVG